MTKPSLIIFDCDGVLVDSEPLSMRVLLDAIAAQGQSVDTATGYRSYLGRSLKSISESLNDTHGAPLGAAALGSMRTDLYDLFRKELQPIPGIADTLVRLDTPFCVASSSQPERIQLSLTLTGLWPFFEGKMFSASMVQNGKPAPDLFLFAAEKMGIAPENCLVIEDSPAGILAAKTAGMRVFGFVGGSHAEPADLANVLSQLGPDRVLHDMQALPDLIG